jgi:hypothetical protein
MGSNIKLHKRYFKNRETPVCLQPYGSYLPYYNKTLSLLIALFFFLRVLGGYPNTYAYTKALSEGLVAEQMDKLPVLILRPSIGKTLFYTHDKLLMYI